MDKLAFRSLPKAGADPVELAYEKLGSGVAVNLRREAVHPQALLEAQRAYDLAECLCADDSDARMSRLPREPVRCSPESGPEPRTTGRVH